MPGILLDIDWLLGRYKEAELCPVVAQQCSMLIVVHCILNEMRMELSRASG
ncbi:hypothetical protein AWB76_05246 [Caballeronia temeraria]|uniref:Uncharacterized protein n=1 Tax=Caballeronia temeraria TaxID=1777137 RepID=A0A158C8R5_9BURK|nr:hypothetical protein AWB76_05246 [Caballeronia temeraria]